MVSDMESAETQGYGTISVEEIDRVLLITLDRPKSLNAISPGMAGELRGVIESAGEDGRDIGAVVITGRGSHFCAGADISFAETIGGVADATIALRQIRRAFDAIYQCAVPTIVAIEGIALGGGCEIAINADFRIASEDSQLGFPEVKIGALPGGGGIGLLPQIVGRSHALQLVLTGAPVDAQRALEIGLVGELTPPGTALERAIEFAGTMTCHSAAVVRLAKAAMSAGAGLPKSAAMELEYLATTSVFGTKDRSEGMAAFLEKRTPNWSGD